MTPTISAKQVASFIYKMARSFPIGLMVMVLHASIWAIDLSVRPYFLKVLLDRASEPSSQSFFESLWLPATAYFLMAVLITAAHRLEEYFVGIKMIPNLRGKIANSSVKILFKQSHSYYQNHFAGSLASKLNDLTSSIPDILQTVGRFFKYGLAIAIATYTLWQVNGRFAKEFVIGAKYDQQK